MVSKREVEEREERIRKKVRELPDDIRLTFFRESERKLKDPDTYATLNYIFIAGLHHFYLGKWIRGLINIFVFWVGVVFLFTAYTSIGILFILAISVAELYALFYSQVLVQDHNNTVMEGIYEQIERPSRQS